MKLGKIQGRRRRRQQRIRWLEGITDSADVFEQTQEDSEGQGTWRAEVHGVKKQQSPLQSNFNHLLSDTVFKCSHFGS